MTTIRRFEPVQWSPDTTRFQGEGVRPPCSLTAWIIDASCSLAWQYRGGRTAGGRQHPIQERVCGCDAEMNAVNSIMS